MVWPGTVFRDLSGADQSAGVTSGIGAPPIGEAPWQPWHFVATTAFTSHGKCDAGTGPMSGPVPAAAIMVFGMMGTMPGEPALPVTGFVVTGLAAVGGATLGLPALLTDAMGSASLVQLAARSSVASARVPIERKSPQFLILTSSILAETQCNP
jgi:hypothetical protein